ncbi:MAG: hypothetical protein M3Y28_06875 [Armatimonadota bacterium]|nr:hypothetical protein [Armatimonadota bacterium]
MSLTIDTSPELEDKLREDAERHGVDAASYALQLLEHRYLRTQPPVSVSDMPKVGTRWRSASGLDADAIEDRLSGEAATPGRSNRRSSRREERRLRRKSMTTKIGSIVIAVALVVGLAYALLQSNHRNSHPSAPHSPVVAHPASPPAPGQVPDAVKPNPPK